MSCESCVDMARERMRGLDNIKQKAKEYAKEINQAVAICKEGDTGDYYLCSATEAISSGRIIVDIVSGL